MSYKSENVKKTLTNFKSDDVENKDAESLCSRLLQAIGEYLCLLDDFEGECPRVTESFCDEISSLEEILLSIHDNTANKITEDRCLTPILITATLLTALSGCSNYDETIGPFTVKYEFLSNWLRALGTSLLQHCSAVSGDDVEFRDEQSWILELKRLEKVNLLKYLEELIYEQQEKEKTNSTMTGYGTMTEDDETITNQIFQNALEAFKAQSLKKDIIAAKLSCYILSDDIDGLQDICDIFRYKLKSSIQWLMSSLRLICYRSCYIMATLKARLYSDICDLISIEDDDTNFNKLREFELFYSRPKLEHGSQSTSLSTFDELLRDQLTTLGYKVIRIIQKEDSNMSEVPSALPPLSISKTPFTLKPDTVIMKKSGILNEDVYIVDEKSVTTSTKCIEKKATFE